MSVGHELKDQPASQPNCRAAQLALQKQMASQRKPKYRVLVAEAEVRVPQAVAELIRMDVSRTFASLPRSRGPWSWPGDATEESAAEREAALFRVLLAYEWRSMCLANSERASFESSPGWVGPRSSDIEDSSADSEEEEDDKPFYVQSLSFLAAMCMGFVGGKEEDGFWLLLYLIEDILGPEFLAPPLVGYHGDRVAAAALVASEAPLVAKALGTRGLAEAALALADRCLLSCFVGFLADEPLLALWQELLEMRFASYPRFPLIAWLAGLVRRTQFEIAAMADQLSRDEIIPEFFRLIKQAGRQLPEGWRPGLEASEKRVADLRRLSLDEANKYLRSHQEQQLREKHAKSVAACLQRTSSQLVAAVRSAEALASGEPG